MTIKQLKVHLALFPDDTLVLGCSYTGDFCDINVVPLEITNDSESAPEDKIAISTVKFYSYNSDIKIGDTILHLSE